jgi:hypothetical protein
MHRKILLLIRFLQKDRRGDTFAMHLRVVPLRCLAYPSIPPPIILSSLEDKRIYASSSLLYSIGGSMKKARWTHKMPQLF